MKKEVEYNYIDYLEKNTKIQNEKLIYKFNKLYNVFYNKNKTLKRGDKKSEINELYLFINSYLETLVLNLNYSEFNILKKIIAKKKHKKADLMEEEKALFEILEKYALVYKNTEDNRVQYYIFNDLKKELNKIITKEDIIEKIKDNDQEIRLIKGIIEAYGAIEFNEFIDIYKIEYPNLVLEDVLRQINSYLLIHNDFKFQQNDKDKYILFTKAFKTIKETNKVLKCKVSKTIYAYEEYFSFADRDYKYNKEYKKLIRILKFNYVFKKNDLKDFNKIILDTFVDDYRLEKKNAFDKLHEAIKIRFEYKNANLEERIYRQIILVAECEPVWLRWEEK